MEKQSDTGNVESSSVVQLLLNAINKVSGEVKEARNDLGSRVDCLDSKVNEMNESLVELRTTKKLEDEADAQKTQRNQWSTTLVVGAVAGLIGGNLPAIVKWIGAIWQAILF